MASKPSREKFEFTHEYGEDRFKEFEEGNEEIKKPVHETWRGDEYTYWFGKLLIIQSEDDENKDKIDQIISSRKVQIASRGQRSSVSAEVYGVFNKKEEFKAKIINKTEDQKKRISIRIKQSILFNSVEDKDLNTIIDSMEEKRYKAGEAIIKQGDNGEVLYLVEEGQLDCFKTFVNTKLNALEKRRRWQILKNL